MSAALPDAELHKDRGAFFKSIYATLNHIAYGDLAFLSRFTGSPGVVPEPGADLSMTPRTRRVLQAILYEVFAIAFVGPVLSIAFDKPVASTVGLAFVLSSIALGWNYVFNTVFERWEARQSVRGRSLARRLVHGIGFEGGLVVILIPVMALWLDIPPLNAFLANLGLLAFFFVYAIAFTWTFDRVFGLPESAAKHL